MSIFDRALRFAPAIMLAAASQAGAADRSSVVQPVPGEPFFVQLAPIFVPVIEKNDSVSHQVSIAVAVEIADGAAAGDVAAKQPVLDDAFLGDIYLYVQQRGGIGPPESEPALKARLRDTAQRILKPVKVTDVEIEEFFQQRQ